jgi:hypothetical protein
MKLKSHYILLATISVILFACSLDNYSAPGFSFTGRIVYQGVPIDVQNSAGSNIDNANIYFYLYEPGWKKTGMPIKTVVSQDGSFSSLLFADTYKLVMPAGVGPYMASSDTTTIVIKGNKTMDIEVTPYYMIQSPVFSMSADSTVSAVFNLQQIITDANAKTVQAVYLYINRLLITDGSNNIASVQMNGTDIVNMNGINLSAKMPSLASLGLGISTKQTYIFARIGLQITGVSGMLFSPVQKITIP